MPKIVPNNLIIDLRTLIEQSRSQLRRNVNQNMVLLYWHIGTRIRAEILANKRADYGKRLIPKIAAELAFDYGRGFSERNVSNMVRFGEVFVDIQILQNLSAKLSWSHFVEIIYRKDPLERDFYAQMAALEGWGVRILKERIGTLLFERTAISKKPEATIALELEQISQGKPVPTDFLFRDPYILDFLELQDTYSEKDLENAILLEMERFLLEFLAHKTAPSGCSRWGLGLRLWLVRNVFL